MLRLDPEFDGVFKHVKMLAPTKRLYVNALEESRVFETALEEEPIDEAVTKSTTSILKSRDSHESVPFSILPPELRAAVQRSADASAIVYALLLDRDLAARQVQIDIVRNNAQPEIAGRMSELQPEIERLDDSMKLPVIDLVIPALRQLTRAEFDLFARIVQELIEADRAIALFEYTLQRSLLRHLHRYHEPARLKVIAYKTVPSVLHESLVLISALVQFCHDEPAVARAAFQKAITHLGLQDAAPDLLSPETCNLPRIDAALDRLSHAHLNVKHQILQACVQAAAFDDKIAVREKELVRAIADSLDCPIPQICGQFESVLG